jgi:cytochrome c oxidase subunit II
MTPNARAAPAAARIGVRPRTARANVHDRSAPHARRARVIRVDRLPPALRLKPLLSVALLGLLLLPASAFADALTPQSSSGSPNATEIDSLYKLIGIIAIIVFVAVEGALLWAFFKYKARKGAVAAQIHGNTRLEVGWTIGAALILVFLIVFTFIKLPDIKNPAPTGENGLQFASSSLYASTDQPPPPGGDALRIVVDGQQYVWRYQYPGDKDVFAYTEMVVPVDTTVVLDITADDVAHSWWIPDLGGKMDAIPGYVNHTWFQAKYEGVYRGQCAELCGRNHANMLAEVRVVSPDEYEAWYDDQAARIEEARKQQEETRPKYADGN